MDQNYSIRIPREFSINNKNIPDSSYKGYADTKMQILGGHRLTVAPCPHPVNVLLSPPLGQDTSFDKPYQCVTRQT